MEAGRGVRHMGKFDGNTQKAANTLAGKLRSAFKVVADIDKDLFATVEASGS